MKIVTCTLDKFIGEDGPYFAPSLEKYRGNIGGYCIKGYNKDGTIDVMVYTEDDTTYKSDPLIKASF